LACGPVAQARANCDHHLWARLCRSIHAISSLHDARQDWPPDADLDADRSGVARGGRACELDRRPAGNRMNINVALPNRRRTLAEELRQHLADEIVRGVLTPGSSLDEAELARRFDVSRTPVREAIRQLAA